MHAALTMDMLATDLADYVRRSSSPRLSSSFLLTAPTRPQLVRKGVPFRETHHVSGRAVALAEQSSCQISELSFDQYRSLHPKFEQDVFTEVFDFEKSVEKRNAIGGPSRETVGRQVRVLRERVAKA